MIPYYKALSLFKEASDFNIVVRYARHLMSEAFLSANGQSIYKKAKAAEAEFHQFCKLAGEFEYNGETVRLDRKMFRQMLAQMPVVEDNPKALPYFKKLFQELKWDFESSLDPSASPAEMLVTVDNLSPLK